MNAVRLVIDTSIFISLLIRRESAMRRLIRGSSTFRFYFPRFFLVELFKHKERIAAASELSEEELLDCLYELLSRIRFIEEGGIPIGTWMEARRLCRDVDMKDTAFVALTLHLDGRLWTTDAELETGLRAKGFVQFFKP